MDEQTHNTPLSVNDVILLIRNTHELCTTNAGTHNQVVKGAAVKLMTAVPLLEVLQGKGANNSMVEMLHKDLQKFSQIVTTANKLNPIFYLVKAPKIHDELEATTGQIQFTLVSAVSVHSDPIVQAELQQFLDKWAIQEKKLVYLRELEKQDREGLVAGDVTANLLPFTGTSPKELEETRKALIKEQVELQQVAMKPSAAKKSPMDNSIRSHISKTSAMDHSNRSQMVQEEAFLALVIHELERLEKQQKRAAPRKSLLSPHEAWVLCPITKQVMTDPVTVDCPCQHAFGRAALKEWMDRGNDTCPKCKLRLRSTKISPSPQLRQAIEERMCYRLPPEGLLEEAKEEVQPKTRCGRWCGRVRKWFAKRAGQSIWKSNNTISSSERPAR